MVVEKAYAKFYGCFETIEGGYPDKCLRDLTGAPCHRYDTDIEDAWEKINEGNRLNYVMVTGDTEGAESITEFGLVPMHAYTLLGAATV